MGGRRSSGPRRTDTSTVQELTRHGADIQVVATKAAATPLHLAAQNGHLAVVRWLLEAGAAPAPATHKGQTPLHLALRGGHADVAELLIEHGAPTDCADERGETPLALPESLLKRLLGS